MIHGPGTNRCLFTNAPGNMREQSLPENEVSAHHPEPKAKDLGFTRTMDYGLSSRDY